jgi:hypothetical protein
MAPDVQLISQGEQLIQRAAAHRESYDAGFWICCDHDTFLRGIDWLCSLL